MSTIDSNALPESWAWVSLGDIGSWGGGGTPSKSRPEFWVENGIPWVSSKDMKSFEIHDTEDHITKDAVGASAANLLPEGTVLLVTRSGILRHTLPVAVSCTALTINQDLKALKPYEGFFPKYIAYAILSAEQRVLQTCVKDGTTVQSVELDALKRFRIPVAPFKEQLKIADSLDELLSDFDTGVEALQRALKKLCLYRASVLKAAVRGELTAEWRRNHPATEPAPVLLQRILAKRRAGWEADQLRSFEAAHKSPPASWKANYKDPVQPDTTLLPRLPSGWCWASLDQIAVIAGGVTKGQRYSDEVKTKSVPYLRVANVQRGFLDLTEIKEIQATLKDIEELALKPNDILFNEGGDRDKLGRGWIWDGQLETCIHQNHVFRARLIADSIEAKLVSHCGNSYGREWFMRSGKQSVNLASINMTALRSFPVALAPELEQQALMEILDDQISVIDHVVRELESRIQISMSFRQLILKLAFAGQLVSQDPNDEPASEMLKRMTSERESLFKEAAMKTVRHKPSAKRKRKQPR